MKRTICIIASLLLFCTVFSGCGTKADEKADMKENTAVIILPQDDTVNGYLKPEYIKKKFYANTKTHKFHKSDCRYAKKISEEYLYTSSSREDMINKGYSPCKVCSP